MINGESDDLEVLETRELRRVLLRERLSAERVSMIERKGRVARMVGSTERVVRD